MGGQNHVLNLPMNSKSFALESARMLGSARLSFMILSCHDSVIIAINCTGAKGGHNGQGGFKNLQNRSRPRQSAHFSSIIGVLAPTAVGGYDFLKPPCTTAVRGKRVDCLPSVRIYDFSMVAA